MNSSFSKLLLVAIAGANAVAAPPSLTGFPFTEENLTYSVNWPSGLSLGEGHLRARPLGTGWSFELKLNASVPGFEVSDSYMSDATAAFCSQEFARESVHGARKTNEKETVEQGKVTRVTGKGGGKSELAAPDCLKDALTLLFYARRELGQGRVPPAQPVLFGALYPARLDYVGPQTIQVAEKPVQADKIVCTLKTPLGSSQFEIYFARDAARTPLLFKVPLAMGRFSMELVR